MSAAVCGSKRSFFEDLQATPTSSPASKKFRCSSPLHFNFSHSPSSVLVDSLRDIFPYMDQKLLEKALEDCAHDLDSAIKYLNELNLGCVEETDGSAVLKSKTDKGGRGDDRVIFGDSDTGSFPLDGAEWVEYIVSEIINSGSIGLARIRASKIINVLEKVIGARASAEAAQSFQKENMSLKQHLEVMCKENSILKRAVAIQHERQKEFDERSQEVQHLKNLISQYQEQLRTLEVNNYALSMHLRQAQGSSSIPGRFHPDVF